MIRFLKLQDRGLISVSGSDAFKFLQGLVTSDVHCLQNPDGYNSNSAEICKAQYSLMLTPKGRYLFDFFLINNGRSILIDCLNVRKKDLIDQLKLYSINQKVRIKDLGDSYSVSSLIFETSDTFSKIAAPFVFMVGKDVVFEPDQALFPQCANFADKVFYREQRGFADFPTNDSGNNLKSGARYLLSDIKKEPDKHFKFEECWAEVLQFFKHLDCIIYKDTRHEKMGFRIIQKTGLALPNFDESSTLGFKDSSINQYEIHRINNLIPDHQDMTEQISFPMDFDVLKLGAVSLNKGCYIGQEIVARMIRSERKKFVCLVLNKNQDKLPIKGSKLTHNAIEIGTMLSSIGNVGLALLDSKFVY